MPLIKVIMGYSVHLNFISHIVRLHKKNCPTLQIKAADRIRYEVWSKDFFELNEARKEMQAAAKFCEIADYGPCDICEPY